jgi:hypothetical protein
MMRYPIKILNPRRKVKIAELLQPSQLLYPISVHKDLITKCIYITSYTIKKKEISLKKTVNAKLIYYIGM